MIKSERKKIFVLALFIAFVVFINVLAVIKYKLEVNKILSGSVKNLLSENTDENIDDFKKEIKNRVEYLNNIYEQKKISDDKNKDFIFDDEDDYFYKIDFIELEKIKSKRYYDELVKNNFLVREADFNKKNDNKLDRFLIMFLKNDCVVLGECKIKSFDNLFIENDFSGYAENYVVGNKGKVIIKNLKAKELDLINNNNFFSGYIKDKNVLNKIRADIKNKKNGFVEYKYNQEKKILNYKPIGINNWYMFSVVPEKILDAHMKNILSSMSKLLFVVLSSMIGLIIYILVLENKYIKNIKKARDKLDLIIKNVPGGVVTRLNNKNFSLSYMSNGFLDLIGYSKKELKSFFDNKYTALIYFSDIDLLKKNMAEQLKINNIFQVEYRLIKKNGEIIWVTERGQLVNNFINSVLIDITRLKNIWDEIKINNEKYKLIAKESDNIIFEFDINNICACSSGNFKKLLDFDMPIKDFPDEAIKKNLIYKDDIKILLSLFDNLKAGKDFSASDFRIKNKNGEFIWCRISSKLILDEKKRPVKAVIKIENINNWKLEQEKLKLSAERDLLTGLYNKITSESLINKYLLNEGKEKKSAMLAIDLDNFKAINDNLGHLAGDKFLIEIANKLKKIFRHSDIIARFGGDEFIVFIKDIISYDFIKKKAQEILENTKTEINNNKNNKYKITCSIGVAIYPKHGFDFKELYKNADSALYKAKNSGKNLCFIFSY